MKLKQVPHNYEENQNIKCHSGLDRRGGLWNSREMGDSLHHSVTPDLIFYIIFRVYIKTRLFSAGEIYTTIHIHRGG